MKDLNRIVARIVMSYSPFRKNDTDSRNKSWYDMVTTYAPALAKFVKQNIQRQADGKVDNFKFLETDYLLYRDEEHNNNKYHYYAVVMFDVDGETRFVGANVYGRVGFGEKYQNLTKGFVTNAMVADRAVDKHRDSKLRKGYQKIKLRQGAKRA